MPASPKAAKEKARKAQAQARRAEAEYKTAKARARRDQKVEAKKRITKDVQRRTKDRTPKSYTGRKLVGIVAYLLVGAFPYAASYFILPAGIVLVLVALWAFGLMWAVRIAHTTPAWALAPPIVAVAIWVVIVQGGDAVFGWIA